MRNEELASIAQTWGTPTFVFDTQAFEARLSACREILGGTVDLCFAMKANPFLVRAAEHAGAKLEVCSPGELAICERAGIDPARIVYSGVNKEPSDIKRAIDYGAGALTAESLLHARYISEAAQACGKVVAVIPRLNAGSQFGMSRTDFLWLVDHRNEFPGINIVGLHYFVGTQRGKLKHQRRELAMLADFLDEVERDHGLRLARLEYGPGLAVPYFDGDDFSDTLAPLRELAPDLQRIAERVSLTIEMGRFFAAECGCYLTRAMDLKSNEGTNYAILDGGMNHLTYYGQMMGMRVPVIDNLGSCAPDAAMPAEFAELRGEAAQVQGAPAEWCLCGSLCTVNDVLVRAAHFDALKQGDVLAFRNAGAYAVTEGVYLFLSRTMPRVLLRGADGVSLVRDFTETSPFNGF